MQGAVLSGHSNLAFLICTRLSISQVCHKGIIQVLDQELWIMKVVLDNVGEIEVGFCVRNGWELEWLS
jgi:hypothetical protein